MPAPLIHSIGSKSAYLAAGKIAARVDRRLRITFGGKHLRIMLVTGEWRSGQGEFEPFHPPQPITGKWLTARPCAERPFWRPFWRFALR